jgi:lipopolysaccharide export system protein LptA
LLKKLFIRNAVYLFVACLWTFIPQAYGQVVTNAEPVKDKIEILADESLEWQRNEKKFLARGNAVASHAGTTIHSDLLQADYREAGDRNFDIRQLIAKGSVRIEMKDTTVTGDMAVYDTDNKTIVVTGERLVLKSPEQTVTATERFEYHTVEGRLSAFGNAVVTHGQDTLSADKVSAVFEERSGKRRLNTASATGNVVIRTPTETLYGDKGFYRADTEVAEITGNVRIERGPNILEGERGQVNLATNVSRLYGGAESGGRVRGVFFPESRN